MDVEKKYNETHVELNDEDVFDKPVSPGRPKSPQKRSAILRAAGCSFLDNGFRGTSLDSIANKALVSKQTIYSYFKNKEDLFSACIRDKCEQYTLEMKSLATTKVPIEVVLREFATEYIDLLHDPDVIRLYRLAFSEAGTESQVCGIFYKYGIQTYRKRLLDYFRCQTAFPVLILESEKYTDLFFTLFQGKYFTQILLGINEGLSRDERTEFVKSGVEHFILIAESAPKVN